MHEVEPQSGDRTEARLSDALRQMAAASRQGARPEIGAGLMTAFRRHHSRRRKFRRACFSVLAVAVVIVGAMISLRKTPSVPSTAQQTPAKATEPAANAPGTNHETVPFAKATAAPVRPPTRHRPTRATAANQAFLALPAYDPQVPLEQLQVVRVQLPASALWQMGAPISAGYSSRRMTADIVLSQGGTPYAVRLVQ